MALLWHPTCSRLAVGGKSEEIKREKKDGMLKEEEKEKKKKIKKSCAAMVCGCERTKRRRGGGSRNGREGNDGAAPDSLGIPEKKKKRDTAGSVAELYG